MNGSGSSASRGATLALWGKRFLVHQQLQKVTRFRRGLAIFLASHLALAVSAGGSFEILSGDSRLQAHTSQGVARSQGRAPAIDRIACPSHGAQPNRPKLIPCGARIDGPQNLRRRSRLRSISTPISRHSGTDAAPLVKGHAEV
jgi:hypothetical protein